MNLRALLIPTIILMAFAAWMTLGSASSLFETSSYREVSAEEVMAEANGSSVSYDGVLIVGDLYLDADQHASIRITNSGFLGNVSCKGTTFYSSVNLENSTFYRNAIFNGSKFAVEANFNNSRFFGDAIFNTSRFLEGVTFDFVDFYGVADFSTSQFDAFSTFYNATFNKDALFSFSEFNGAYANFESSLFFGFADFAGCRFNSYGTFACSLFEDMADFHATRYSSGGSFSGSQFLGSANFDRSHFVEDSFFNQIQFNDTASFLNAKFDGPASFSDSKFYRDADFDKAQFLASTDMSNVVFLGNIMMNNTKIARMVLDGSTFMATSILYLANADISRMMVDWSQIRNIISFDNSAYLALIKNYKDLGRSNDANDCYYEYRYLNQGRKSLGFSKLLDVVAWLTCGYGVRPNYTLLCGAVVILLFSIVYLTGRGVEGFSNIHGLELFVGSLYYSTIAFTANSKGLPLRGRYKYLGIAEGIVGWLLMALFLVTLGRVIIG